MGSLLILIGLAGFLFGLVNVVYPLGRLGIETRRHGAWLLGASFVVAIIGGAFVPPEEDEG